MKFLSCGVSPVQDALRNRSDLHAPELKRRGDKGEPRSVKGREKGEVTIVKQIQLSRIYRVRLYFVFE